jgi:nicotinamidase-related amidase
MGNYQLNRDDTVLLIIDLQEKLMKAMSQREKVYKNTNLLTAAARDNALR